MSRSSRRLALAVAVLLLGVGGSLLWLRHRAPAVSSSIIAAPPPPTPSPTMDEPAPAYSPLADELNAAGFDTAHDLEVLRGLIGQLTTTLRLAELPPLGDNADLAAALTGRNLRRIVFIPADHPALGDGLLLDRWSTPYHFHARAADAIDARSAGPDRVLFTADDLVSSTR